MKREKYILKSMKILTFLGLFFILTNGIINVFAVKIESNPVQGTTGPLQNLEMKKTADSDQYRVGDIVQYEISISLPNWEPNAGTILIGDTMTEGMELLLESFQIDYSISTVEGVNAQKDYTLDVDNNTFTLQINNKLAQKTTVTIQYQAIVKDPHLAGQKVTNTVTFTSTGTWKDSFSTSLDIDILAQPQFSIKKTVNNKTPYVQDTIQYTMKAKQLVEDVYGENVVITDEIPEGIHVHKDTISIQGVEDAKIELKEKILQVIIPKMEYNEEAIITYNAIISDDYVGKTIDNVVTIYSENNAEIVKDNAVITVLQPQLAVTKKVDQNEIKPGNILTYTIQVSNTVEGSIANDVIINDTLSKNSHIILGTLKVSDMSHVISMTEKEDGITIFLSELAHNNPLTFTYQVQTNEDLKENDIIHNMVHVSASHAESVQAFTEVTIKDSFSQLEETNESESVDTGDRMTVTIFILILLGFVSLLGMIASRYQNNK